VLQNLHVQSSQEEFYCQFLQVVYGNHSQTLFLSSNYKLFSVESDDLDEEQVVIDSNTTFDAFAQLNFGGDIYKTFIQHADGVFEQAVVHCYGCFISLTEPIISQT
jgi:hypothetical protein